MYLTPDQTIYQTTMKLKFHSYHLFQFVKPFHRVVSDGLSSTALRSLSCRETLTTSTNNRKFYSSVLTSSVSFIFMTKRLFSWRPSYNKKNRDLLTKETPLTVGILKSSKEFWCSVLNPTLHRKHGVVFFLEPNLLLL